MIKRKPLNPRPGSLRRSKTTFSQSDQRRKQRRNKIAVSRIRTGTLLQALQILKR